MKLLDNFGLEYFWNKIKGTFVAKSDLSDVATSGSYDDLEDKPSIPDDNNLVHTTGDETIYQKKTFAANGKIYLASGWNQIYNEDDEESLRTALNARNNVQADWNQTTTTAADYIKNKPTIKDELSSEYEMSSDSNDDLYLDAGDTYEEAFGKLEKAIVDNELVSASALNDLNERIDEIPDPVKSDWNAASGSDAEILNKPIVRTIINLENELPSRLFNAIGEENAITLTAEEASKFESLESKVRSRIDSNGYAYIYYYRGSEWEIDIDSLYNSNEYYFVTYELGIHTYVTINTNGSYEENDNVWVDTNFGSLDFVLTKNTGTLFGYIKQSSTSGLIKNDGTVDTNNYLTTIQVDGTALTINDKTVNITGKLNTLVSGTNIKTINNESILGSGNITIENVTSITNNEIDTIWNNVMAIIINFSIMSSQYLAIEGMTWAEWVNSLYNTDGYYIGADNRVYSSTAGQVNNVIATDVILPDQFGLSWGSND